MAFINIEVEVSSDSVTQLNSLVKSDAHVGVKELETLMAALLAGAKDGQVKVAVRSTTASVAASGGGSSATYDLK